MKKPLLILSLAALTAFSFEAYAEGGKLKAKIYNGIFLHHISPNGKWAAGSTDGAAHLLNLETGELTNFVDEEGKIYYGIGTGVSISNDGVLLLYKSEGGGSYWDGEFHLLPVPENATSLTSSNCITPDGKRIAGSLGLTGFTTEDKLMIAPAVWTRKADGTYSDPIQLPHPATDFSNRVPQSFLIVAISDDGKTIAGQEVDFRGTLLTPIVWKEDAEGNWSYSLPLESLINPNHVVIPTYPGDAPKRPDAGEYLSEEKLAEWQAKYNAWIASGYKSDLYPGDKEDFLSEEEKAAYDAAVAEYNQAYNQWEEEYSAFDAAYMAVLEASPTIQQNQLGISPDGKTIAFTYTYDETADPDDWFAPVTTYNYIWTVNLETNEITKYEQNSNLMFYAFAGDNIFACAMDEATNLLQGYILKNGTITSMYDYLCSKGEEVKNWVDLNLTHEIESYDPETYEPVNIEVVGIGAPAATPDLSTIITWTYAPWDPSYYETCVYDLSAFSGLTTTSVLKKKPTAFDKAGNLVVGSDAASVAVYDLTGKCITTVAASGKTVNVDCPKGIYIVKTVFKDGSSVSSKLIR